MTMNNRDLNALIRDELDNSAEDDPGAIADAVAKRIRPRDLREAVRLLLRSAVRDQIRATRHLDIPRPVTPTANPSRKIAVGRNAWARFLRQRLEVPGSGWKSLGEFTYEDLMAAADERRRMAAADLAQAGLLEKLAAALAEYGVSTVSDLPAKVWQAAA